MPVVEDLPVMGDEPAPGSTLPQPSPVKHADLDDDDEDDEDIDESLLERLIGLTEMFPESVRNLTVGAIAMSIGASKWIYSSGRSVLWVAASSATILALPVMFETERSQMEEQQMAQQRQILLGPNAAVSGSGGAPGMMPPPPPAR